MFSRVGHVSFWPKVIQRSITRVKFFKALSFGGWKLNPDEQHIKTSVLKSSTTVSGHTLTGVVIVDHSDEKRVHMGQKSSSLRNLDMWRITRSFLRFCSRFKYQNLITIVNVDHSDETRVQMGQKSSTLRNLGMWHITRFVLRCSTRFDAIIPTHVAHVDHSDEKRCQNVPKLAYWRTTASTPARSTSKDAPIDSPQGSVVKGCLTLSWLTIKEKNVSKWGLNLPATETMAFDISIDPSHHALQGSNTQIRLQFPMLTKVSKNVSK